LKTFKKVFYSILHYTALVKQFTIDILRVDIMVRYIYYVDRDNKKTTQ
jgi:hypothetical protein